MSVVNTILEGYQTSKYYNNAAVEKDASGNQVRVDFSYEKPTYAPPASPYFYQRKTQLPDSPSVTQGGQTVKYIIPKAMEQLLGEMVINSSLTDVSGTIVNGSCLRANRRKGGY